MACIALFMSRMALTEIKMLIYIFPSDDVGAIAVVEIQYVYRGRDYGSGEDLCCYSEIQHCASENDCRMALLAYNSNKLSNFMAMRRVMAYAAEIARPRLPAVVMCILGIFSL
jgi:hypothetical protein